jgi:hypothetical protein
MAIWRGWTMPPATDLTPRRLRPRERPSDEEPGEEEPTAAG